jgi:chemotaxis protein CheY-P-specific phosphatase CheC
MSFEYQYRHLKPVARQMLLELGVDDEVMVSDMTISIINDLYEKYSGKSITAAIRALNRNLTIRS